MWMLPKGHPFCFVRPRMGEGAPQTGERGAFCFMTREEASKRYQIPIEILEEYERWGLCGTVKRVMGVWQYGDEDLERLSTIMALHDVGFAPDEVESYMRLLLSEADTARERMRMLERRRDAALDEIHLKEKQLQRLDYLRYRMRSQKG